MPLRYLDARQPQGESLAMVDTRLLDPGFPPAGEDAWRALVAKTLGDKPIESLTMTTVEGLAIQPLYSGSVEAAVFATRPASADRPWDVRTLSGHPDPARVNADLLADLQGGAASIIVKGHTGVAALSTALKDVIIELAPVGLDAGFAGPEAAEALHTLARSSPGARLNLNLDPISAFAEAGASPGPITAHLAKAAQVAARLVPIYPQAQMFLASGRVVHEAGGGEALEVAVAATAAIAYVRAMTAEGLSPQEAFARITLGLSADTDYFVTIAKLRAARRVFARLATASGAQAQARIEARSSARMLTAQDAWSNMIRLSVAGFGAAVGGADAVVLGTYSDAVGLPLPLARRQSRNAQLVLMEEANIGRVSDPAAGSGYLETLTDQIARAAWSRLQVIEAAGGLIAALQSGLIADDCAAAVQARGKPKIVGVTAFPPTEAASVEVDRALIATPPDVRLPGADSLCPPLKPMRLSERSEATS